MGLWELRYSLFNERQSMFSGIGILPAMVDWRHSCKPTEYGHWWGWVMIILWFWLIVIFNPYAAGSARLTQSVAVSVLALIVVLHSELWETL